VLKTTRQVGNFPGIKLSRQFPDHEAETAASEYGHGLNMPQASAYADHIGIDRLKSLLHGQRQAWAALPVYVELAHETSLPNGSGLSLRAERFPSTF
jgi:hypothetical protein